MGWKNPKRPLDRRFSLRTRILVGTVSLLMAILFVTGMGMGQQASTATAPIYNANAKYVQGVAPGYWPKAGAGLTLNLAAGSAYCGNPPTLVTYAAGTLTMVNAATNLVYLDPANTCLPSVNQAANFAVGQIPIAKVVTAGSVITTITDMRGAGFAPLPCAMSSAGAVGCSALGTNQNITLTPSGTGSVVIPGASGDNFQHFFEGPAANLFNSLVTPGYFNAANNVFGCLNAASARTTCLTYVNQSNVASAGIVGMDGIAVDTQTSGSSPLIEGNEGDVFNEGTTSIPLLVGASGFAEQDGSGTVNQMTSLWAQTNARTAGTVTTNSGLLVDDQNGVGTTNYSVNTKGSAPAHFNGGFDFINKTCMADAQQPLTNDESQKIGTCIAALPSTGGTVDARGFQGAQAWSINPFAGVTKPVRVLLGAGTYTVPNLVLPVSGTATQVIQIEGSGIDSTILRASAANQPIFSCAGSACDTVRISNLAVQANASGSTGPAIDESGFRSSILKDIQYLSNGTGNFANFFHFASSPYFCYNNLIDHPVITGQTGPPVPFLFDTGGTGIASNTANITTILHPWIYLNTGITTIFNALRSAHTSIKYGDLEANTGAVVAIPGTDFSLENTWMESNATTSITGSSAADGTSSGVTIAGNYISGAQTFTIPSGTDNWVIKDNTNQSTNLTVTDNSGGGTHNIIQVAGLQTSALGDTLRYFQNTSAGGGIWALNSGGSAGAFAGGGFGFRDITNNQARFYCQPLAKCNMVTGSSTTEALRLIPSADSSASYILTGTNNAQSAIQWGISQAGTFFGPSVNLFSSSANCASTIQTAASGAMQLQGGAGVGCAKNDIIIDASGGNVGVGTAGPNLQLQVTKAIGAGVNTVAFSATPTFDASLGNTQTITLTGNVTSATLSNCAAGEFLVFDIIQDATGSRTFVWPTNILNAGTIGATASKHNIQQFYCDGTNARATGTMLTNQN